MFETFIVQPVFNLLVFIYGIIPGHNFGLAIILFTILVRLAMHPLVKKQLHHAKAMRDLQPEIDAIKKNSKGDKQKAAELTMELYKEREISPFSSLGVVGVQVVVLVGLFAALRQIASDTSSIINNSYEWVRGLGFFNDLAADISRFDFTLFGWADLSKAASSGGFYFPAFVLVTGSAIALYYMGKQTLPDDKKSRSLKQVLRDKKSGGEKVQQSEVQAITGQGMKYAIPVLIFIFTYGLPAALALYWLTSGVVGYVQQKHILQQDEKELIAAKSKDKKLPKA